MACEFSTSVDYGLRLSKRIYLGKGAPPTSVLEVMSKSETESYLPMAVMAYAVVTEPAVVYNPDVPSYQPSGHGQCDPPALIPLHMYDVCMVVDCCMDTAFVTVTGVWRVHCIMASKRCDCLIVVPMGEQGSLLDVEVDIPGDGRSYNSKWVRVGDTKETGKFPKAGDGSFLKPHLYTFKIPQVEGGSKLSIKVSWSQKLLYQEGQFCLSVPFTFPAYVIPVGKRVSKREKILLTVNSGIGTEILCQCTSHPLKELSREFQKLSFIYEAVVKAWSGADFNFSYTVSSRDIMGGVLLQSPSLNNFDTGEMFCFYLFPGNNQTRKVFRKEVVFIIHNSGSMQGAPLESVKTAVVASLSKLNSEDSFNIICFNVQTCLFSSKMEQATHGSLLNATQWLNNLTVDAGTSILILIQEAMKLLADASGFIPLIFLVTDGTVEDEREVCNMMKEYMTSRGSISPRICTFGIGLYCNHYFLQMLAQIGRGQYDRAYDADSLASRIERLFTKASSIILANITIGMPEHLGVLELFPSPIPDLSFGNPLIVSGIYKGDLPENIQVSGILADMTNFVTDLQVQNAKDVPLERVFARRQIDAITTHAWFSRNRELEEKVAKISLQTSFPSEYTCMVLFRADSEKKALEPVLLQDIFNKINQYLTKEDTGSQNIIFLGCLGVGFGNLTATAGNQPSESPKGAEISVRPGSHQLLEDCCVASFNKVLQYVNDHCCLPCFQWVICCFDLCCCIS